MNYSVRDEAISADTHVIAAAREIDLSAVPELRETMARVLVSGRTRVLLDLSEATFIDSTAIGVLVSALKRLRQWGGSLEAVCTDGNVLRVFEIVGLDREIPLHPSREAALHESLLS